VNSRAGAGGVIRSRPLRGRPVQLSAAARTKHQPKSAADLDKELDAFMGDGKDDATAVAAATALEADVDMA
jgi:hypothetical protein